MLTASSPVGRSRLAAAISARLTLGVEMSGQEPGSTATRMPQDRPRRPLRCGEPAIHEFRTEDDVLLRLTRFEGGPKGPVILTPGFGTSAFAYTIDTTDTPLDAAVARVIAAWESACQPDRS